MPTVYGANASPFVRKVRVIHARPSFQTLIAEEGAAFGKAA